MGKLPNTDPCQDTKGLHLDGFDVNFYFWVSRALTPKAIHLIFPPRSKAKLLIHLYLSKTLLCILLAVIMNTCHIHNKMN